MTLLAKLIAQQEGFGRPGDIPTVRDNPGDLRHSPHSQHPGGPGHANDIGTIDTDADGWADLERQLQIHAALGYSLRQMVNVYCGLPANPAAGAAVPDGNNVAVYRNAICNGMGMPPETLVKDALKVSA